MRSGQSFVITLLVGAFGLVPINVVAQGDGFLVLPSKKAPKEEVTVHVVQCKPSGTQQITCDILDKTLGNPIPCRGYECSFQRNRAIDYPGRLLYGVSTMNPTCVWIYDWTSTNYYPVCW